MISLLGTGALAQESAASSQPTVALFHFAQDGATHPRYTIQLQSDGVGVYWVGPPDFNLAEAVAPKRISASPETVAQVFAALPVVASGNCETRQKHVAQTGRKTLVFQGGNPARCEFNYSADERLNRAATALESVAETIHVAEQLMHDRRFDKLAMDRDMDVLVEDVKLGQAIEVQNIAETLQAIVADESLIERVRRKAARLLEAAGR